MYFLSVTPKTSKFFTTSFPLQTKRIHMPAAVQREEDKITVGTRVPTRVSLLLGYRFFCAIFREFVVDKTRNYKKNHFFVLFIETF